jgi:tRNA (mo5U34)-methyltransferase
MTTQGPTRQESADGTPAAGPATDLAEQVAEREWYHTIELSPGVETPGWFDLREVAPKVLPDVLKGKRCLDIASFDGFWALSMQDRGASEVLAIDVLDPRGWDWPAGSEAKVEEAIGARKGAGEGFDIVMSALDRQIVRRDLSVYDLDPAELGTFDFVYFGSLLLHLRDPVRALERARSVCSGEIVVVDAIDPVLTAMHPRRPVAHFDGHGRPWWWKGNAAAIARMVESAGFELVGKPKRVTMPPGRGQQKPPLLGSLRSHAGRTELLSARYGDPHVAVHARPRV